MTDLKKFAEGVEAEHDSAKLGLLLEQLTDSSHTGHSADEDRELREEIGIVLNAMSHREFEAGVRKLSPDQLGALLEQQEAITQAVRDANKGNANAPELVREERRLHTVTDLLNGPHRAA